MYVKLKSVARSSARPQAFEVLLRFSPTIGGAHDMILARRAGTGRIDTASRTNIDKYARDRKNIP